MTTLLRRCLLLATALLALSAEAQELILHLPFDGSLGHSGRTGEPRFVTAEGAQQPAFVPGHSGQALSFIGPAAVAAPFNLDHAQYPRVTVTAWVREEAGASGSRDIFSSTSTAGVRVGIHGGRLAARLGGRGIAYGHGKFPVGEWVFVAAVIDTAAGSARLYQNDGAFAVDGIDVTTSPPPLVSDPANPTSDPEAWVVVGATNFETFSTASRPLIIDDVRVYASALSPDQIAGLRDASTAPAAGPETLVDLGSGDGELSAPSPNTPVGGTAGGMLESSDALPTACQSHEDCPDGQYCAIEQLCHLDRHAPMQSQSVEIPLVPIQSLPTTPHDTTPPRSSGEPRPIGAAQLTSVSGVQSKVTHTMDLSDKFLTSITWWEKSDRPCGIRIEGSAASEGELTKEFYNCGKMLETVFSGGSGMVGLPTTGMTASFAGRAIGALEVCSNTNRNRRMKGLRISGDWIGVDGTIHGSDLEDQYQLSNCRVWQTTVSCGLSRLATGIVVHVTRSSGYNEQIVGLQLICRRIGLEDE